MSMNKIKENLYTNLPFCEYTDNCPQFDKMSFDEIGIVCVDNFYDCSIYCKIKLEKENRCV